MPAADEPADRGHTFARSMARAQPGLRRPRGRGHEIPLTFSRDALRDLGTWDAGMPQNPVGVDEWDAMTDRPRRGRTRSRAMPARGERESSRDGAAVGGDVVREVEGEGGVGGEVEQPRAWGLGGDGAEVDRVLENGGRRSRFATVCGSASRSS
jgi:hypothetical protein